MEKTVLKKVTGGSLLHHLNTITLYALWTVNTLILTNGPRSGTYGVCPLVSLKSDFEIEITLPSTIDAETIAENPGAYYGQKVTNYTAGGKTYRIFYVDTEGKFGDKNTIYLKADWTSNDTSLSDYPSYTPSGTDLKTYKKLNPSWAAAKEEVAHLAGILMNMQQHGYVHQVNGQHIVIHQKQIMQ